MSPRRNGILALALMLPLWFGGPLTFMEHALRGWFVGWCLLGLMGGLFVVVPYFVYEVVTNRE